MRMPWHSPLSAWEYSNGAKVVRSCSTKVTLAMTDTCVAAVPLTLITALFQACDHQREEWRACKGGWMVAFLPKGLCGFLYLVNLGISINLLQEPSPCTSALSPAKPFITSEIFPTWDASSWKPLHTGICAFITRWIDVCFQVFHRKT